MENKVNFKKIYHNADGDKRNILEMVVLEPAWAANRIQEMESCQGREYQEYEFCKAKKCVFYIGNDCVTTGCRHTAKDFHRWLRADTFKIIKQTNLKGRTK